MPGITRSGKSTPLDIIDKHRRLNIVSPLGRTVELRTRDCRVANHDALAGPFVDATPITRYEVVPIGANVNVTAVFAFDITFGEGELLQGEPVIQRLYHLRSVAAAVVSRFDSSFVRNCRPLPLHTPSTYRPSTNLFRSFPFTSLRGAVGTRTLIDLVAQKLDYPQHVLQRLLVQRSQGLTFVGADVRDAL
jgi:hypothetical protein